MKKYFNVEKIERKRFIIIQIIKLKSSIIKIQLIYLFLMNVF